MRVTYYVLRRKGRKWPWYIAERPTKSKHTNQLKRARKWMSLAKANLSADSNHYPVKIVDDRA